jgi:hypothetical protein
MPASSAVGRLPLSIAPEALEIWPCCVEDAEFIDDEKANNLEFDDR